ncbi:lantibiotic dehydratase [Nonomuraea jabiensis]|uniref:lantibiotic dehydratase n=1 Tax=Nonomuraea jabiensis TaxID=882448 RepID=UPI0036778500
MAVIEREESDGPPVAVRTCGVAAAELESLRWDESYALVTRLLAETARVAADGRRLAVALGDVIGRLGTSGSRPVLVGLRRALHTGRLPSGREWGPEAGAALPYGLRGEVEEWVRRARECAGLRACLPEVVARESLEKEERLRAAAADPAFRRGLALAGGELAIDLETWLADPARRPKPQKLLRLAKYLVRAAVKTSPYSTFTSTGRAVWGGGERHVERVVPVLELDGVQTFSDDRVRVNPSVTVAGGTAEFIGPPPGEALVSIGVTEAVAACLRVAEGGEWVPRVRFAEALGAEPAAVMKFLDKLLTVGLLEAQPDDDPPPDLLDGIRRTERATDPSAFRHELGRLIAAASACRAAAPGVDTATNATPAKRVVSDERATRGDGGADGDGAVGGAGGGAAQGAGSAARGEAAADRGRGDGGVGRAVVHEVAVWVEPVARLDLARWRDGLADLDVVRRWLAVFDAKHPMRLAVAGYLTTRYGPDPAVPFLTLHRHIQRELAGAGAADRELRAFLGSSAAWTQPLATSALPGIRELERLRAEARSLALDGEDPDGTCRVSPGQLTAQLESWPSWIAIPASSACYVQAVADTLVLNVVHGGHGRALRRLDHLVERAGGHPQPPRLQDPDGAVYAEFSGNLGSTLNARPPSTRYEIDYPHSPGTRPPDLRLPLTDLHVTLCPDSGLPELRSKRLGRRVVPLHLGLAAEFRLPPAARFIERVFGPGYLLHPSSPPLVRMGRVPSEVTRYPRVEAGRVVVQRRRWLAPGATLPVRAKGEGDAAYLTRLVAWADEYGVPHRSFVRAWPEQTSQTGQAGQAGQAGQDKARKPLFLDLANLFLVKNFERQIRGCAFALFEEALPDPGPERVTEYLIEVGGR